jgi:hypothetical protein
LNFIKRISKLEKDCILKKYGNLNIHEEENPKNKFYVGILDRFNKALEIEEAENLLISYDFKLNEREQLGSKYIKQETQFLNFFQFAYELNEEQPVYVYCPDILNLYEYAYSKLIKTFNEKDRQLLKYVKSVINDDDVIFKVENKDFLNLFAKLSLRELCFSNFFFENTGTVIIGNYELSFPIYSLTDLTMNSYDKKAREIGLFIRK